MLLATIIMAACAVFTLLAVFGTIGVKIVSKMSSLITSVDALNRNMEQVVNHVGDHESRISFLEGVGREKTDARGRLLFLLRQDEDSRVPGFHLP